MEITLARWGFGPTETLGDLLIDGRFECYTLEDVTRPDGEKVYGQTAIPYGRYRIIITHSPRFKMALPLVLDVPGFEGIRFHPGNTHLDTDGCILVGDEIGDDGASITSSRTAFARLFMAMLNDEREGKENWLHILRKA